MHSVLARATALACCISASTLTAQSGVTTTPNQTGLTTTPNAELGAVAPLPAVAPQAVAPQAAVGPQVSGYLPLTPDERWNDYVRSVVGPMAFVGTAFTAGLGVMGGGSPRFWERDPGGFGQRFGTAFAAHTVNETVKASLSAVLHEDNTYYRCTCSNVFGRIGHALGTSVLARNDNGSLVPAFGRIAGDYAGGLATMELYQHGYGLSGGLRLGTSALATHALTNVFREFVKLPF